MDNDIKQVVAQFETVNNELKSLKQRHDAELKAANDGSAEAKQAVTDLAAELKAANERHEEAMDELVAQMKRPGTQGMSGDTKTMGEAFVESAKESMDTNNMVGKSFQLKDITGAAASGGALVDPARDPAVYRSTGGMRQLRIADLIPPIPIASNAVEIMRLANAGGPAAPQGTVAGVGAGELAQKANITMEWELVTINIPTIAVHTKASRQVLTDAPQMRSIVDGELTYKLQLESDAQLLTGDGTGQNLTGILNDTSINNVGEIASGTTAAELPGAMIDHIRAAVTQCQLFEYYNMTGLVLNPVDWQTLETAKATDGHYLLVAFAATSAESPTVWRIPVIVTNAMPESSFLLGDWNLGAQRYVREGVNVRISEHHADNFTGNAVTVLAEQRYGLGISRPKAFATGSFTVAI